MLYTTMDEMVRNIDRQIFLTKENKVAVVYAKNNVTDEITYRKLTSPKETLEGTLKDIKVVCPPLGLFNTKNKDLVYLTRAPRRQYQIGISPTNTKAFSKRRGEGLDPHSTIMGSPNWYEKELVQNEYPSVEKALELNKDKGILSVAVDRYVYLTRDDEYKRFFLSTYDDRVIASMKLNGTSWAIHEQNSILKTLGV